ncbi:hypothetical protein GCM10020256_44220 [Streptomyces thermocoprophilus]
MSGGIREGTCSGDDGGPVFAIGSDRAVLVGVNSFASKCGDPPPSGRRHEDQRLRELDPSEHDRYLEVVP